MNQIPQFFETNEYFINQKVNYFKFESEYKVFGVDGQQIGFIKQRLSTKKKILSLFLGKAMMPFHLEIQDMEGKTLAKIKRGWTFFMSEIQIVDGNEQILGYIKQKWAFMKPTFHMSGSDKKQIATIKGDWRGWNFSIKDSQNFEIGKVSKKWAGAMKEVFTTADNYNVSINEEYHENSDKIVVVATAITIDMVLKESK